MSSFTRFGHPASEDRNGRGTLVPCVGIFWFVMRGGGTEMLARRTPWCEAEDYGDFKTDTMAHYAFWPLVRRKHRLLGEYEDWPRGRVVYNVPKQVFTAYIDRQLSAHAFRAVIIDAFRLPTSQTLFAFDAHYSGARFKVGAPAGYLVVQ
ncbi:hypothetical protein V5F31_08180 [Xanthobacter sp. V7C-4]|uniref:hypothetical protein n=1 Tax=Xanthobacter autotrophicus (strain ATCC BAA-1158 / Py2) TaxID=78245 RepID=UPI00372AC80A